MNQIIAGGLIQIDSVPTDKVTAPVEEPHPCDDIPLERSDTADRIMVRSLDMDTVFEADPRAAMQELPILVEEVYALIEQEMPEIEINRLRHFFRYRPHLWEDAPPLS